MPRRGRDLFELLELRHRSPASVRREPESRGSELALRTRAWFGSILASLSGPPRRRRRRRGRSGSSHGGVTIRGIWLVAMLLVAVGAGFLLGRGTAGATGPDDLRVGPQAQKPGLLPGLRPPERGATDLSVQKEVETLSNYFYVVLTFADSQRDRAGRLAQYLRGHDLDTARIRMFPSKREGYMRWATLVYVPDLARRSDYCERLRAVPPPAFEPGFAQAMASLDPTDLKQLKPPAAGGDQN